MSKQQAIKLLVDDGFDVAFATKATEWFASFSRSQRDSIADFVRFVSDNEYIIRAS